MNTENISHIPHNCFLKLQATYENLKSAEKHAADYVLKNPKRISSLTINEFAQEAGCSESTVVRLSKRLGYEGYPEMKEDFEYLADNDNSNDDVYEYEYKDIHKEDPEDIILDKLFSAAITSIKDTHQILDKTDFKKAIDVITKSKKIMFVGVGDAALVAMEAYQKFLRIGYTAYAAFDHDLQLIMASKLEKDDVLLVISHSGRSKSIIDVVKEAQAHGAKIISITNFPFSQLAKKSDINLLTAVFSKYPTGEVVTKRITELCILEGIYFNCLIKMKDEGIKKLLESNKAVSVNKL